MWSDSEAQAYVEKYKQKGVLDDVALRVYSARLIGSDSNLVLHGGGNCSVKVEVPNAVGEKITWLAIKGSGWDLSNIEPEGFPLVDLNYLRKLHSVEHLSDELMVNELRTHMMNASSPTPSVETLLHAIFPHKYVDHSHADKLLAILDQPNAEAICREIYGEEFGIVPYIMPGFDLAKLANDVYKRNPKVKGLLLLKHGLFTFGETAKESYLNHINAIRKAEAYINSKPLKSLTKSMDIELSSEDREQLCGQLLPLLRGIFFRESNGISWIFSLYDTPASVEFATSREVDAWSQRGPLTPDHVIRTKGVPLLLKGVHKLIKEDAEGKKLQEYLELQVKSYIQSYHNYFNTHNATSKVKKIELDPLPRVILIEGLGMVTVGTHYKDCSIAADIYTHTIHTIQLAESVGTYEPVSEKDRFDMEYWSLEQAKLGKATKPALEGKVVFITGGASGIGLASAVTFGKAGGNVFIVDINQESLDKAAKELKAQKISVMTAAVDVSKLDEVRKAFTKCIRYFGGVDILISNAGKAYQSDGMANCSEEILRESFNLNFFAHQWCASESTRILLIQNYGGVLLFNASKAALNPGKNFGPYCTAKAATVTLMKQYALEYGAHKIRSNAVNADRVRTNLFSEELIKQRASARNLPVDEYFKSNLLHEEVLASDVAAAFYQLALSTKTTAAILTVDGGNIEASVR